MSTVKEIKMEDMTRLRELSRRVASSMSEDVNAYLKTLTLLFSPRKVLGEFMAGGDKGKVVGAEKNFSLIEEQYKAIMRDSFGYATKLSSIVPVVSSKLMLNSWESLEDFDGLRLTITSPTKWVLGYESSVSMKELIQIHAEGGKLPQEKASTFVIAKLVMKCQLDNSKGLVRLIEGLGYKLTEEKLPSVTGELPHMVLHAPIESFRPQDDLVKMASQFSGSSTFEELIDEEAINALQNPLKDKLDALL